MQEKSIIHDEVMRVSRKLGIEVREIILFGSRARGTARKDSDWDILILTDRPLGWRERLRFTGDIQRELARKGLATDILVISKDELERIKDSKEYVYYYALREGVRI